MKGLLKSITSTVSLISSLTLCLQANARKSAAPRDEPARLTEVNVTTADGLVTRDLPEISFGYNLIGCIDQLTDPVRVLNHQIADWDKTSTYTCVVACFQRGLNTGPFGPHYLFAGIVNGDQCWCDNTMNVRAQSVDLESRCNHLCENNPHEYCGGSREYQMYFMHQTGLDPFTLVPKPVPSLGEGSGLYNYKGCYGDNPVNGRVLRALSYSGPEVTPAYCSELCWAYGYVWAGVEYGHECYCDSSIDHAGPMVNDNNCNQVCDADTLVTCGAPNFISIYHTDAPSRLSSTF